ncbi:MAG: cytochrome b/b6 domain-containing protein [Rhizobium sp.]|nr:cytochrome b/b6 domain-containing protein [Rhizobium sp.]
MAALFFGQFWLGWYMQGVRNPIEQYGLYQWHKAFGFTILGLAGLRILWAVTSHRPRLPVGMPDGEKALARGSHVVLYLALVLVPLTGWAVVSTSPLPIASWFLRPVRRALAAAWHFAPRPASLVEPACLPRLCGDVSRRCPCACRACAIIFAMGTTCCGA